MGFVECNIKARNLPVCGFLQCIMSRNQSLKTTQELGNEHNGNHNEQMIKNNGQK